MKKIKKVVALILSTFPLIQPTSQLLCRAVVAADSKYFANQRALVESALQRATATNGRALQLADDAPPALMTPLSVDQFPPADLESADRLLSESGTQIFTNDALKLNFFCIALLPRHRTGLTFLAQFLRSAVAARRRIPAADFSHLIAVARFSLRIFSAPCFGTTFTPELTELAAAIAFAEGSHRSLRDALAVPFTPAGRPAAVSMLRSSINNIHSTMELIISDVADRSLSRSAVDLVDAQLTRDALQQSGLAADLGVNLQEINYEISRAETLLRSRVC